jgi:MFS family permease
MKTPIVPAQSLPPYRWALLSLALSMLLSSLGTSIAYVGLPTLASAFDATFQQVQWVVLAYLLAITVLMVGAGRLGDLIGRRRLLLGGIALFTAAALLCAGAPTLPLLVAARAVQGLGAAVMMALTMALVGETVPQAKSGSAMGLLGTMSAVGTALGPTLGGVLIAASGWQALFLVNAPLGLLALLLAYRFLPADLPATSRRLDHVGTVLLALIRRPGLSAGLAMSALATTVVMATLVVGPFYLSGALALDAAGVGLVMSSGPIVAALAGVPAGRAVDRLGARRMIVAGLLAMAVGCVILPLLAMRFGVPGYIAPLAIITAGFALFQAANNTAVMTTISPAQRGVVAGMLGLSRNLGLITGASLMGAVYAFGGMRITFAVAALLCGGALVCAAIASHSSRRREPGTA